jgi:hypothetical protein
MASVANVLCSEVAVRVIAGIRTENEVEPVSIVTWVVTLTNVPISVLRLRICDPAKCLITPIGLWSLLEIQCGLTDETGSFIIDLRVAVTALQNESVRLNVCHVGVLSLGCTDKRGL